MDTKKNIYILFLIIGAISFSCDSAETFEEGKAGDIVSSIAYQEAQALQFGSIESSLPSVDISSAVGYELLDFYRLTEEGEKTSFIDEVEVVFQEGTISVPDLTVLPKGTYYADIRCMSNGGGVDFEKVWKLEVIDYSVDLSYTLPTEDIAYTYTGVVSDVPVLTITPDTIQVLGYNLITDIENISMDSEGRIVKDGEINGREYKLDIEVETSLGTQTFSEAFTFTVQPEPGVNYNLEKVTITPWENELVITPTVVGIHTEVTFVANELPDFFTLDSNTGSLTLDPSISDENMLTEDIYPVQITATNEGIDYVRNFEVIVEKKEEILWDNVSFADEGRLDRMEGITSQTVQTTQDGVSEAKSTWRTTGNVESAFIGMSYGYYEAAINEAEEENRDYVTNNYACESYLFSSFTLSNNSPIKEMNLQFGAGATGYENYTAEEAKEAFNVFYHSSLVEDAFSVSWNSFELDIPITARHNKPELFDQFQFSLPTDNIQQELSIAFKAKRTNAQYQEGGNLDLSLAVEGLNLKVVYDFAPIIE